MYEGSFSRFSSFLWFCSRSLLSKPRGLGFQPRWHETLSIFFSSFAKMGTRVARPLFCFFFSFFLSWLFLFIFSASNPQSSFIYYFLFGFGFGHRFEFWISARIIFLALPLMVFLRSLSYKIYHQYWVLIIGYIHLITRKVLFQFLRIWINGFN